MIVRDKFGIIVQPNPDFIQVEPDGGDSAFTTGIMAFSGSDEDFKLMPEFIKNYKLMRHPYQTTQTPGSDFHNDPKSTSRDQLIAFMAGLHNRKDIFLQVTAELYANNWFINRDILMPNVRLYLYKLAQDENVPGAPIWLEVLGRINQALAILWDAYIKPDHEMNQSVVMNTVYGKLWLKVLYKLHPDLCGNITEYFSGWRGKPEIGIMFNDKIKSVLGL